jgi:dynein heavy chain
VHWTADVEKAMTEQGLKGVMKYSEMLNSQLMDTVNLVQQKLSKLQRMTLGALIVIDVHAQEVVQRLVADKIDDVNAFEWIQQLRYYWENENCRVKCI